jgi:hypothetical protein
MWNESNEYKNIQNHVFVVIFNFENDLKCFQNNIIMYNNYSHLYIIFFDIFFVMNIFNHCKNYEFLVHNLVCHMIMVSKFITFYVVT